MRALRRDPDPRGLISQGVAAYAAAASLSRRVGAVEHLDQGQGLVGVGAQGVAEGRHLVFRGELGRVGRVRAGTFGLPATSAIDGLG